MLAVGCLVFGFGSCFLVFVICWLLLLIFSICRIPHQFFKTIPYFYVIKFM
jgi:hypothetical protein